MLRRHQTNEEPVCVLFALDAVLGNNALVEWPSMAFGCHAGTVRDMIYGLSWERADVDKSMPGRYFRVDR